MNNIISVDNIIPDFPKFTGSTRTTEPTTIFTKANIYL